VANRRKAMVIKYVLGGTLLFIAVCLRPFGGFGNILDGVFAGLYILGIAVMLSGWLNNGTE
jgi:hypothetical protein